jgi:chorismate dehydratase
LRGKINQLEKIKVGIVNYLNTIPLLYGINHSPLKDFVELIHDYPSNIASFLMKGQVDIGLVPVAILPRLKEYHIYTEYCIGCDGPVASVCLFSEVPIEDVETILLDYQSHTSVSLLRILLRSYWKVTPSLVETTSDYRSSIREVTAGLVIGDRSFEQRKKSKFVYDLGEAWKKYTGLPFVFATWTSTRHLDEKFVHAFDEANAMGVQSIQRIIETIPYSLFDMKEYFTNFISYKLDDDKRKGLNHFLELLKAEG